ncbi:TetR/AcrR family transcriptional regulator [Bacillus sp. HMF5848]|uniref:TetR/AcrR family transcriptional regulator n=1 Tax=Bacillus sp. HMF5848 TaxID=2495421 RepID=UPI000F7A0DAF|nr:TetR/AcrR family transcriptional regulator [Bacillus sp. HMF5848]RSK25624.1 TetR/AcrR family transcriptional regulator [Bacillus sp. HMF5848]
MSEKENSKTKLIQTASRLFQLQGYHGTGLNQITKESGAPKGSLYYHFPEGKEQLAMESIALTSSFIAKQIAEGLKKKEDPVMAIQELITDMATEFQNRSCTEGVPIAAVALETSLISETLQKACQSAYETFQGLFTDKLQQAGYSEERAKQLGIVIHSMIEGAFLTSFTTGNNASLLLVAESIPVLLNQKD